MTLNHRDPRELPEWGQIELLDESAFDRRERWLTRASLAFGLLAITGIVTFAVAKAGGAL